MLWRKDLHEHFGAISGNFTACDTRTPGAKGLFKKHSSVKHSYHKELCDFFSYVQVDGELHEVYECQYDALLSDVVADVKEWREFHCSVSDEVLHLTQSLYICCCHFRHRLR